MRSFKHLYDLQVVICDTGLNDVLKYECWSNEVNARCVSRIGFLFIPFKAAPIKLRILLCVPPRLMSTMTICAGPRVKRMSASLSMQAGSLQGYAVLNQPQHQQGRW